MDETEQVDFIGSACNAFADAINRSSGTRLRGKDGYEVLSLVFGEVFTPADLRGASAENIRDLVMASWELLESRVSPETVSAALAHAVAATNK